MGIEEEVILEPPLADFRVRRADFLKELVFNAYTQQAEYGRWVVAALLTTHGGALLAITQVEDDAKTLFSASGPWLIFGLFLALITGGLGWLSFTTSCIAYVKAMDAHERGAKHIAGRWTLRLLSAVLFIAPVVALASACCLLAAGWKASGALS
ncbi:hypothetical protein [Sinorhizobium medicae]|uniref:hypothetical protein n=1 Tax=Sinorhizobium medicae TaxID=110321 RepID=UPI000FDCA222|nr:hypothetical protein [Sinorhizobium medicae]RVI56765.1 hypothetical protein CN192_12725 [Sinorhizobium medicae]